MSIVKKAKDFYPKYLLAHQNKANRFMHILGNIATLIYLNISAFILPLWTIIFLPFIVYPFAWFGHRVFEKNKPATWSTNPLITKICDWMMMQDIFSGLVENKIILYKRNLSMYNRNQLLSTDSSGCFYCLEVFSSTEIKDWTDSHMTAICPRCGVDSVVPMNKVNLRDLPIMHESAFSICKSTNQS